MAKVITGGIDIVVMSVSVDEELDVMGPLGGRVGHVDLLSVTVMVGIGSIKHAKPSWRSEITAYHADIDFHLTWFRMCSRWWTGVDRC